MRTFLRSIAFAALLSIAPTLLGQFGSDPELRPDLATVSEGSYVWVANSHFTPPPASKTGLDNAAISMFEFSGRQKRSFWRPLE